MRRTFLEGLTGLAARDPRIVLLTGDLGYTVVEPFARRFPDRFFNVGVAEQNMIGLATGLAEAGFVPFAYSIATFASLRPYEAFRNGPIRHRLPVRLVGTGGGFEYGSAGSTHHGLEDLGVMRIQPGLMVVAPADHRQALAALLDTWDAPGPIYFRLGKDDEATVPGLDGRFDSRRPELLRDGEEMLMVSVGAISREAAAAVDDLGSRGIRCGLAVLAVLSPPPLGELATLLSRFRTVMTVEAHYVNGALGSLISEVVAERQLGCRVIRCGIGAVTGMGGSQRHLERSHGLSAPELVEAALRALGAASSALPEAARGGLPSR